MRPPKGHVPDSRFYFQGQDRIDVQGRLIDGGGPVFAGQRTAPTAQFRHTRAVWKVPGLSVPRAPKFRARSFTRGILDAWEDDR